MRRGVGATLASAVLFSSLIASNFLVVAGAQQMAAMSSLAGREEGLEAQVLSAEGASLLRFLDRAQSALSTAPISCAAANSSLAAVAAAGASRLSAAGVTVTLAASQVDLSARDNATALAGFQGAVAGEADFVATVVANGTDPLRTVQLRSVQRHFVHIPVMVQAMAASCLTLLGVAYQAFSRLGPGLCNLTSDSLTAGYAKASATEGGLPFRLDFGYSLVGGGGRCSLALTASAVEDAVAGPLGAFDCTFTERDVVYWPRAPQVVP